MEFGEKFLINSITVKTPASKYYLEQFYFVHPVRVVCMKIDSEYSKFIYGVRLVNQEDIDLLQLPNDIEPETKEMIIENLMSAFGAKWITNENITTIFDIMKWFMQKSEQTV